MNIIIALCLIYMILLVVLTAVKIFVLNREERYNYLANFKKGKFVLLYLVAIPLFYIGISYAGNSVASSIFKSITSVVEIVFLKFEYSSVTALMKDNLFYRITIYTCFSLALINALVFTISVLGQRIQNYFRKIKVSLLSKRVYVIVGYNEKNISIIKSINKKKCDVLLLAETEHVVRKFCYVEKIAHSHLYKNDSLERKMHKFFKNYNSKEVIVVINTEDDMINLIHTKEIATIINREGLSQRSIENTSGLTCYSFGIPQNASTFLHITEKTNGAVHYVNKYLLRSLDFVDKYPLTEFMTEEQIDYKTATIKKDVELNVVMIGFGQTCQQLFLTSVANNQFGTLIDGKYVEKPVNYYIYDKRDSRNDKILNHNYCRFDNELDNETEYLDLPSKPAREKFFILDINDIQFYNSIKKNLSPSLGNRSYSYIIVSYGSDMENIDFAEKIVAKLKEWGLFNTTKVFVKIRNGTLSKNVLQGELAKESGYILFGNEEEIVYNIEQIISEKKEIMARDRHLSYSIKAGMSEEDETKAREKALNLWLSQSQVQRESNIYSCLSIRMKLHLLGFDYAPEDCALPSANEEFLKIYQAGDPIIYSMTDQKVKGKQAIVYTNNYVEGSIRQHFAILEHQRWNAYMITCGYIPSTIEQIKAGDSKNTSLRRHGNITTFDGLIKYREIVAKINNCSEEDTDVIRYDYVIMDDLVWILTNIGQKIVERNKGEKKEA